MTSSESRTPEVAASALYRAFWRWHFYAGLIIMPVLMLMALTGGLYLFKPEIEGLIRKPLLVAPAAATTTTPESWVAAASQIVSGRLVQVVPPASPTDSARLVFETSGRRQSTVYLDPHNNRVLGVVADGGLMETVKRLHSLDLAGPIANLFVEVVAGWAIVMVATGLVLWWPRGQTGGVISVRGRPERRIFWRDLHAVTGLFAGAVIIFLAVTGMPWSAVWGKEVRKLTNEAGWGRPAAPATSTSWTHVQAGHAQVGARPWALQDVELHKMHMHSGGLELSGAIAAADRAGLTRPYAIGVPAEPGKAWTASHMADQVEQTRTLYLDSRDGTVLAEIGYDRFGPAAKAIEWGISVHQGQQFGLANKLVMLAGCVSVWLLGVSALVMWWKRRPQGRLAAPPRPVDRRMYLPLLAVVLPLAILYPLVGASLAAVLLLDILARSALRVLQSDQEIRS